MTDRNLTGTDAALRERIAQLCVHIPCGHLRGPVDGRWQSCRDEDSPERWKGYDVSSEKDLCIICFRATAGGTSRWSWLACADCRRVNAAIAGLNLRRACFRRPIRKYRNLGRSCIDRAYITRTGMSVPRLMLISCSAAADGCTTPSAGE